MGDTAASSGFGHVGPGKLRPRGADGWAPGAVMSFGVHVMLVAALALGVRWKIDNPQVIEAEVWSEIPQAAAPADAAPPPLEAPQPETRQTEAQRAEEEEPPVQQPIPDLVIAPKPKKEEKKKPKREPVEVFESAPPKVKNKPEKKPEKKIEQKADKKPVTPPPKPVNAKVTSPQGTAKAAAEREAQRNAQLQRMMNDLGSVGSGSQSSGPSASYAGRIRARIKPRIVFTDSVAGNPEAEVEVRCGPDGRILSRRMIQSSGVPRWDEAVLRAIDATEVLPVDENGKVPSVLRIAFRPNDL